MAPVTIENIENILPVTNSVHSSVHVEVNIYHIVAIFRRTRSFFSYALYIVLTAG